MLRGQSNSWTLEKRFVHKDGRIIWVIVNGTALRDENGRVIRILAMINDITARKQAELQLHRQSAKPSPVKRPRRPVPKKTRGSK